MRRQCLCGAAVLLLVAAANAGDDATKADLKKMEGSWKGVAFEMDGKKPSDEELKKGEVKVVIKGDTYTLYVNGKTKDKGTLKLNAAKKPKEIDATGADMAKGKEKGDTMLGIYELKGDEMRVCFAPSGKDRPTAFSTKEGSGHMLIAYKRIKE